MNGSEVDLNSFAAKTDAGRCRDHNEDSFLADADQGLWVVADGMGGHEGGEVASAIAVQEIQQQVQVGHALSDAIYMAHQSILKAVDKGEGRQGMGSTVVALHMIGNHFEIAWVGDSRAYLWNGRLRQLSRDHSFVQQLLDSGAINEEEALAHPDRSVISQALGADAVSIKVDSVSGELYRGERLLLCSDGLSGEVDDQQISSILSEHPDDASAVETLVQAALDNGGSDNVTVILFSANDSFPLKPHAAATVPFDASQLNNSLDHRSRQKLFMVGGIGLALMCILMAWYLFTKSPSNQPTANAAIPLSSATAKPALSAKTATIATSNAKNDHQANSGQMKLGGKK